VNRFNGFVSLDCMFSILPVLILISFTLQFSSNITERTYSGIESQIVFDKLVSVGDYIVKIEGVKSEEYGLTGKKRYPNWINERKLSGVDVEGIRKEIGLDELEISLDMPKEGTCIYRIVVTGTEKEIRRLFICGG